MESVLTRIRELAPYRQLLDDIRARRERPGLGLPRAARLPVLAGLHIDLAQPILFITDRADHALSLYDELGFWLQSPRYLFSEPNPLFYEHASWSANTRRERMQALAQENGGSFPPMDYWSRVPQASELHYGRSPRESFTPGKMDGVPVDATCIGRFYDFFEKRQGRWAIVRRQPIYEKDRLDPVDPMDTVKLDSELLAQFPEGYRHLGYLQVKNGFNVKQGLPGLRGSAVEKLYSEGKDWLAGSEQPGVPL